LHLLFRRFHRFRRVLLLVFLDRLPFGLFPIRAIFRLCVLIFDRSVRTCSINDPKRIMTQHKQLCGGLEPLGSHIGFPGQIHYVKRYTFLFPNRCLESG
jgi:hypothetical protein